MVYSIPVHLLQSVVDYLEKQPFNQVAVLLSHLRALQPLQEGQNVRPTGQQSP